MKDERFSLLESRVAMLLDMLTELGHPLNPSSPWVKEATEFMNRVWHDGYAAGYTDATLGKDLEQTAKQTGKL